MGGIVSLMMGTSIIAAMPNPAVAAPAARSSVLVLQLVPAIPNVAVSADGNVARSNARGIVKLPVNNFTGLEDRVEQDLFS